MFNLLKEKINQFKTAINPKKEKYDPSLSISTKIKSIASKEITLSKSDLQDALFSFELSLLEADVDGETAQFLVEKMEAELLEKKFSSRENLSLAIKDSLKSGLKEILNLEKIDISGESKECLILLFLGPNGAGKTTTIAKLASYYKAKGKNVVLSASDTFRAASIEQLSFHASKTDSRIVKHDYNSDPAAVAFDAVKAGQAKGNSVVLIDTAGRQETNKNLLKELEKIVRVSKPHYKIFIGESYSGKTLLEQAKVFNHEIGIDAFILTKLDTDPKGGTMLSLVHSLKKPVLYVGVGQEYSDLEEFDSEKIIERILE